MGLLRQRLLKQRALLLLSCVILCSSFHTAGAFGTRLWNRIRGKNAAQSSQSFQDILLTRRTINNFEATLPDDWETKLRTAIHAATFAPNHKRTEPWRFHLLGPESIQKVCKLNSKLVSAKKGPEAGDKKLQRWLAMPGWLVVTCQTSSGDNMREPTSLAREDYAACCCALQNLCLSLHSMGMGTKWTTGPVNFDPGFADAVGFSPIEEYVVGTIWFGTPAAKPSTPSKKLGVEDVLIKQK